MASDPDKAAPTISTHVLDTELGAPAVGVHVTLYRLSDDGRPLRLTQALTDGDGRVRDLLERPLVAGDYRLEFHLGGLRGAPFAQDGGEAADDAGSDRFFQRLSIDVRVADPKRSYHVPLLLAPFSATTYRGS